MCKLSPWLSGSVRGSGAVEHGIQPAAPDAYIPPTNKREREREKREREKDKRREKGEGERKREREKETPVSKEHKLLSAGSAGPVWEPGVLDRHCSPWS